MNLLQAGVDISTIAIWLGHKSIEPTHKYMVADLEIKRKALEKPVKIDTMTGAKASAIIYSIAETANANNLNPYRYFELLLSRIPEHLDDHDRSFLEGPLVLESAGRKPKTT